MLQLNYYEFFIDVGIYGHDLLLWLLLLLLMLDKKVDKSGLDL
jgi:hypothetical protein